MANLFMGKLRQKKNNLKKRNSPLYRKRVEAGIQQATSTTLSSDQIAPVADKLTSNDPTERAWAAACVSNLFVADGQTRKSLLSKGVLPHLIDCLNASQQEVREEALGALRNLASVDPSAAKEFYSRNIMQPLSELLPEIIKTIDAMINKAPLEDDTDMDKRKSIWDVTENFIYVIWSICEASDKYIVAINRMNIITFLTSFLQASEHCPTRVVIAAGQCLNTLTDNNRDIFIEFQNHPEYTQRLLAIVQNPQHDPLVQVLACAILINIREIVSMSTSWADETDSTLELHKAIVPVLTRVLAYDLQEVATKVKAAVESGNIRLETEGENAIAPTPKQALTNEELYLEQVENHLSIVQLALELLADICVQDGSEEDGYEDVDETMKEEGEETVPVEENEEEVEAWMGSTATAEAIRNNPVVQSYIQDVLPQLIRLSTTTPISYQPMAGAAQIVHGLTLTHQRALECLNNFLLAMNELPTQYWYGEHSSDATQLWRWLFLLANEISTLKPAHDWLNLLETIIGCLWALGRGLGQHIPLIASDVQALCGSYDQMAFDSSIRVKIVGCLGPMAMRQGDIETNKTIGIFIMNLIQNATQQRKEPSVLVEALNFMYDVYSDCEFDYDFPVFVQGGFLKALNKLPSPVRAMVKAIDGRKNHDLRERGDEALLNLKAFIQYKKTEQRG
ncbi:armadillo-type protein [Sporodiniella umbellata]|nr:armadillo-type protein [Sporodiniella umbellata]